MRPNEKRLNDAVRAFWRVYNQKTDGFEEAAKADAEFDAGEWSSGGWSDNLDELHADSISVVSIAFNLRRYMLADHIDRNIHISVARMFQN